MVIIIITIPFVYVSIELNRQVFMKNNLIPFLLVIATVLSGCSRLQPPPETLTASITPLPTRTPQPPPPSSLTVCLGQEPNTLYPFGELNSAARSVLAAIYNGPIDTIGYEYQPVILTRMPSLESSEAQIARVQVQAGSQVVDADGNLVSLDAGVRVRPAGCRDDDCVITYDGTSSLEMEQMIVTFRLRPDLMWADGTPLTADDSIYAFEIQANNDADAYRIDRTQVYEAADAQTLQWFGMPGFIDPSYFTNFWQPAPKHLWSQFPANELPSVDIASRTPTGWGPYMISEWIPGDHITLTKNPYYFRGRDGYPKIDTISFRFISDPNTALSELVAERCDILDPTINLDNHVGLLQEMQAAEQAQVFITTGMTIEWLGLGIAPASYDDGFDLQKDRQDFFADNHTRQGIAYCLDRQSVVDNTLFGLTTVPTTYVPVEHPAFDVNIAEIPYDPEVGISLLELAGWLDTDDDPSTPRRAVNVPNVAFNTPLQLDYFTTTSTQRRQAVEILQQSLAECGIGLNVEYFSQNDLYAPGPNGFLFGRRFDLAQYALGVEGIEPPCGWFTNAEIPSESNSWIGTNITGFRSDEYDAACRTARISLRDEQAYVNSYRQTQIILSNELPVIPLYYRLRIAAARPEVCHFDLDPTANPLWNIDVVDIGETCQK
jgi:peptide/nickel transport system substrate-binding protein